MKRRPGWPEAGGAGAGGEGKGGVAAWAGGARSGNKAGVDRRARREGWRGPEALRPRLGQGSAEDPTGTGWLLNTCWLCVVGQDGSWLGTSCRGFLDTLKVLLPFCFPDARTYFGGGPPSLPEPVNSVSEVQL